MDFEIQKYRSGRRGGGMIMMGCVGSVSMGLFIYVVYPTFWLGCPLRLGQLVFIHTRLVCLTSKIQVPP